MNLGNEQPSSKYLRLIIIGCLYLILIAPVLVSSKFVFPFITTKTMWFRILAEVAGVLWIILFMINGRYRPVSKKLNYAVVIFGLVIFLTAMTGLNFYKSFWGTIERGEGFLTVSHIILFFLIISSVLKSKKEWFYFLSLTVLVGLAVDVYALAQRLNTEKLLFWTIIHSGEGRLSATIGNASFLAGYVLINIFVCLLLFSMRRNIYWRIFFILAIVFNLFILINTQTRGALVALIAGALAFFILLIFGSDNKKIKIASCVFLGIIVLFGTAVWFNRQSSFIQKIPALQRLTTISYSDITTQSRLLTWQASLKGFRERPIFGYGWDNYNIAFNKYFPAPIFRDSGSQLWFDRAHNYILDVMVASGVLGITAYLAIFVAIFFIIRQGYRKGTITYLQACLLGTGVTAYVIQNIFVFDTLSTYLGFYTVLAFINFLDTHNEPATPGSLLQKNPLLVNVLSIVVILFGVLAVYNFNLKPLQANETAVKALIAANMNDELQAVAVFKKAIDMQTYQTAEIRQKLADNVLLYNKERGMSALQISDNYNYAIEELKNNMKAYPYDVQNYLYLMTVYNAADNFDASRLDKLVELGKEALELSPTRPQIYFEMGQARLVQGKREEGIGYFKKAVELSPDIIEANWNLWAAYALARQKDKGEEVMVTLRGLGYNPSGLANLKRNLNVYINGGDKENTTAVLKQIAEQEPSANNFINLAIAYRDLNLVEESKKAAFTSLNYGHDQAFAGKVQAFLTELEKMTVLSK